MHARLNLQTTVGVIDLMSTRGCGLSYEQRIARTQENGCCANAKASIESLIAEEGVPDAVQAQLKAIKSVLQKIQLFMMDYNREGGIEFFVHRTGVAASLAEIKTFVSRLRKIYVDLAAINWTLVMEYISKM